MTTTADEDFKRPSNKPTGDVTWTPYLIFCMFSIIVGSSFNFGYNLTVLNLPYSYVRNFLNESSHEQYVNVSVNELWTITVSLFLVGGIVGAAIGSFIADQWGRLSGLMISDILFAIPGGLLLVMAPVLPDEGYYELFMLGRVLVGIHCGTISCFVAGYLGEIAPFSVRGVAASIHGLTIAFGGLLANVVGLSEILKTNSSLWMLILVPTAALPALHLILLLFVVESPRWIYLNRNSPSEAERILRKLRGSNVSSEQILRELTAMEMEKLQRAPNLTFCQSVAAMADWRLVICLATHMSQQLTGKMAVLLYSTAMLRKVGFDLNTSEFVSLGITVLSCGCSLVGTLLVDRFGRRILLLAGYGGMFLSCIGIVTCMLIADAHIIPEIDYATITFVTTFALLFDIGPSPIPWMAVPEMYEQHLKRLAATLCTVVNWICRVAVSFGFPYIQEYCGPYMFVPFLSVLTLTLAFTWLFYPETKGRNVQEIRKRLAKSKIQIKLE